EDRPGDDLVFRNRPRPREPERRKKRLAAEVVPLVKPWVERDTRQIDIAPTHGKHRRVHGGHACSTRCFKTNRWTLPVAVRGSSSTTTIRRGRWCGGRRSAASAARAAPHPPSLH